MKNRNSSPAKSILETATQTASSPQPASDSPPRAIGIPADVLSPSTASLCHSATQFTRLGGPLSPAPSAPLPLDPSAPTSSELSAALDYIAQNPASEILGQFQSHFSSQSFDPENEHDLKRLDLFLSIYAKLQNSAAFEQVSVAINQAGEGPKREKLLKELIKVMSIQDRSIARGVRQQESIAKEKRRIEREAKQAQSQAAKHAREDRAFNQREDHLSRKEKLVQTQLDVELYKRANLLREQVIKYAPSQPSASALGIQHSALSSQAATMPT